MTSREDSSRFQSQPPLSITPKTWRLHTQCTKTSPCSQQPRSWPLRVHVVHSVLHIVILIAGDCKHTDCCGLWCLCKRKWFPESLQVIAAITALILKSRKKGRSLLPQPQKVSARAGIVTEMQIFPGMSCFVPASPLVCLGVSINMWGCCYCVSFS